MANIHKTALVANPELLPDSVTVGPYSVIEEDVTIAENVWIDSHVSIKSGARIGPGCKIHHGAAISGPPQDMKFAGEKTELIIGANCTFREFTTMNRGTIAHGKTEIGDNCLFMAYTHVAHDCLVGSNVIVANLVNMGGHVVIDDWAFLGGGTVIHQFCHIGEHMMVGGGFRIAQDVIPYSLVAGFPISCRGLNITGLTRRNFSPDTISKLKSAFNILLNKKLKTTDALVKIENEVELIPEVKKVVDFIRTSERGVIK
ncbi:MAG: acyl-ACP--UDP-N-acetylglucosamine O-acyltransferase [candidate division Zixibacteria bacterium]|nr:acyl-ACP--UDP-N-acetylglucosamine O-acyltransferase [candidate division Zixibacteria bacterium]